MKFSLALILTMSLVACSSPTSDEEQVRAVFASAEEAAEERDAGDVLELVDARLRRRAGQFARLAQTFPARRISPRTRSSNSSSASKSWSFPSTDWRARG